MPPNSLLFSLHYSAFFKNLILTINLQISLAAFLFFKGEGKGHSINLLTNAEDTLKFNVKSSEDQVAKEGNLNTMGKEGHSRSRTENLEECIAGVRSHA